MKVECLCRFDCTDFIVRHDIGAGSVFECPACGGEARVDENEAWMASAGGSDEMELAAGQSQSSVPSAEIAHRLQA
jgi:hypothetical protein